jgi:two-component system, chemotaxis family, protein-glutamate methylesterase/glutaminase
VREFDPRRDQAVEFLLRMRDIICVGASAGGVEALQKLVAALPANLGASVFVVLHIPPFQQSRLAEILDVAGPLPAAIAKDGEPIVKGRIYVASPDHHLLLERGSLAVIKGPKENRFRPAIDPLFRSAAQHHPKRAIGVLLSGLLDDGTAGLWALKRAGGTTIIQDLTDAIFPDMPRNASQEVEIDHTATAAGMGSLLTRLSAAPTLKVKQQPEVVELTRIENEYAKLRDVPRAKLEKLGTPASLICPACSGPLWQLKDGPRRFRCHTGHSFTPSTLIEEHRDVAEKTLGVLMTLFDDEVTLSQHILETSKNPGQVRQMKRDLRESEERAAALRKLLPGGYRQRWTKLSKN